MDEFISPSGLSTRLIAFTENLKGISIRVGRFNVDAYTDTLFKTYQINLPEAIDGAVKKRKAEFLCGRFLAHKALKQLDFSVEHIPIGKNRAPIFPNGCLGSISHTQREAICAAARLSDFQYLGVDLEEVITTSTMNEVESLIINEAEKRLIYHTGLTPEAALTLAYSVKESIFKALHPSVGYYFDFSAARIKALSTSSGEVICSLARDLSPELPAETLISGEFCIDDNTVLSAIFKSRH